VWVLVSVVIPETCQQYLGRAILDLEDPGEENLDRDFLIRDSGSEW
jgi:hypothetical protein